jgi:uncharacterized membrane protein
MSYEQTVSDVSKAVEVGGIGTLIAGGVYALAAFAADTIGRNHSSAYGDLRRTLGQSILFGLEILSQPTSSARSRSRRRSRASACSA